MLFRSFEHHFFIKVNSKFLHMTEEKLNELFYDTDDIIKNKKIYDKILLRIDQLLKESEDLV